MKIKNLSLIHTAVPLKKVIKHASHERAVSENLIVRVELGDETTFQTLARHDWSEIAGRPTRYEDLIERLAAWEMPETAADSRGRAGNAAHCAVELAILDAYGRHFNDSIGKAVEYASTVGLECRQTPQRVRYSSAIMAETAISECLSAFKTWLNRFKQVKIKVGVADQDDRRRLARLRWILGERFDVRIDANESWQASDVLSRVGPLRPYRISALEQPVPHEEVDSLAELRPHLGIPVMLDESVCGYPDAIKAIKDKTADILNIRLSKCGGILSSLKMMGLAIRSGLGVQLGCHPGETAILSAAGRHVASRVKGIRFVEGSYDRYVLAHNLSQADITFGYGGWAPPLEGPGLGIHVDPSSLERMTLKTHEISYE